MDGLVAQYESTEHSIHDASPAEMLAFLLDARGVSNAAVARETGIPRSVITDILAGRPRTRTGRTSSQSVTGKPPKEQIKEA